MAGERDEGIDADTLVKRIESFLRLGDVPSMVVSFNHNMFHVSNKERTYAVSAERLHVAINTFVSRGGKPSL